MRSAFGFKTESLSNVESWCILFRAVIPFDKPPIDINFLTTIRCLVLSFTLNMACMSNITNTAWDVASLNHIRASNCLEELVIMVHHDTKQDTTPDTDEWSSDLDRPLDQEGFEALG
jgi:hypothetical protein